MELPKILKGLTRDGRAENQLTEAEKEGTETREWHLERVHALAEKHEIPQGDVQEILKSYKRRDGRDCEFALNGQSYYWREPANYPGIGVAPIDLFLEGEGIADGNVTDEQEMAFYDKYSELLHEIDWLVADGSSGGQAVEKE